MFSCWFHVEILGDSILQQYDVISILFLSLGASGSNNRLGFVAFSALLISQIYLRQYIV